MQVQTQAQVNPNQVEAVTNEIIPNVKEILEKASIMSHDEILEDVDNSIVEYKKAKEEIGKLGFDDYKEYLDFLGVYGKKECKEKGFRDDAQYL